MERGVIYREPPPLPEFFLEEKTSEFLSCSEQASVPERQAPSPVSELSTQSTGSRAGRWGWGAEGGGRQGLWPPHECCGPVSPAAFVHRTSMCGLEPKRAAFSKAAFRWLRLQSRLRGPGHMCLFPSQADANGTDAAMEAVEREAPSPFKRTRPRRAPTRRARGRAWAWVWPVVVAEPLR